MIALVLTVRKSKHRFSKWLVFGGCLFFSITANCQVFKCNESGRSVYSDTPCNASTMRSESGNASAGILEEGLGAYARGDFNTARSKLSPLADKGVAMAQNTLGRMYLMGEGVAKNPGKALKLFEQAANSGLAAAQNNLGVMYMADDAGRQDFPKALGYFRSAANQGFSQAMLNLAEMYSNGFGVLRDTAEASRLKALAKAKGAVSTNPRDEVVVQFAGSEQFEEGMRRYYRGNYNSAFELLRQAAELGHPEAQLRLSLMYREGQGVPKDMTKGDYWETKAKANGRQMDDGRDRVIVNLLPPGDPRLKGPAPPRLKAVPGRGGCAGCPGARYSSLTESAPAGCQCD